MKKVPSKTYKVINKVLTFACFSNSNNGPNIIDVSGNTFPSSGRFCYCSSGVKNNKKSLFPKRRSKFNKFM
jgi:hypothetical protein